MSKRSKNILTIILNATLASFIGGGIGYIVAGLSVMAIEVGAMAGAVGSLQASEKQGVGFVCLSAVCLGFGFLFGVASAFIS